jgi:FkbM family methyltransferase
MLNITCAKFLQILTNPGWIKGIITLKKCFSISSFHLNAALSKYQPKFHAIIDGGANKGQFALAAAQRFPMADIYCFEPVPDVYDCLMNNVRKFSKIHPFNHAIGNNKGKIPFYRNELTPASSAMPMLENNNRPNCDPDRSNIIEVDILRLDDFTMDFDLRHPILLKLDVQGYEKEVLKGAEKTLNNVNYIILETSFCKLYENQPLFDELHHYIKNIGFELVAPLDVNVGNNMAIIEMDVLYKKID